MRLLAPLLSLLLCVAPALRAADAPAAPAPPPNLAPLKKWLAGQAAIRTVQADFVQTRAYRTFNDPIAVPGHLWFAAPHSFRWELGDPPKTVVLRKGDAYYLIQPTKQRAERSSVADLGKKAGGPGATPMMDFPLAKNFDDFNRRFEVLSLETADGRCHVEMTAKDPQMAKFLNVFKLDFDTGDGHLLSFEFVLKNGSSMRNEFSNVRLNGKLEPARFDYDFTGYDVTDSKP